VHANDVVDAVVVVVVVVGVATIVRQAKVNEVCPARRAAPP